MKSKIYLETTLFNYYYLNDILRKDEKIANKYILAKAIPESKIQDALHIAIATLSEMNILVSWNCDHIVKFKTQQIVKAINLAEGLNDIAINTPQEVI